MAILGVVALVAALLLGSQSRDRGRRLKSAQQQVASLRQQLSSAQRTATDATRQRDLLKQQLDDTKTQNDTLKKCLTDIRAGDIAAAANDQKGVDAADQKASADCPKADVLLGSAPPTA